MTLSAPNPWATVVEGQASTLEAQIAVNHPDLADVQILTDGLAVVVAVTGASDRMSAAWWVAVELAPMWPRWLADVGVGCVISIDALLVVAGAEAMEMLAFGALTRPQWFDLATASIG